MTPAAATRRALISSLALLALAALSVGCERRVARDQIRAKLDAIGPPHLVLLFVDTLRADWTSPYGDPRGTSPELARWAARGVVFEQVRAQSSWTKISMASTFTSLWPRSHAIRKAKDALADTAVTLAEALAEGGYRTYGVQTNGWLDQSFGFQQGFEHYIFPRGIGARKLVKSQIWPHADNVLEEAFRLIDGHDGSQPLFLYLHFMDVHEYAAPPEFKTFGGDAQGAYLAAIRWEDDALERVRAKLDDAGLLDRAVIVFAGDHGEAFGENGKTGHARNVLTSTIHTPLLIRLPFPLEPIRVKSQVRNIDIAPTLLDLAGIAIPPSFEGQSLLPLLWDPDAGQDRVSFAGLGDPLFPDASIQVSMTDGSWTYARNLEPDKDPVELLFDRGVDPGENVNLLSLEPEQAERMRKAMDAYLEAAPAEGVLESDVRIDPNIADRLRAMGYLQ
jgi:arylsulfatase A-like enzyme